MPKRPCALALTSDNNTILSADKFGDVYALPLLPTTTTTGSESAPSPLPSQPQSRSATPSTPTTTTTPAAGQTPPLFKSQANELTVHTKRNLRALENQKISLGRRALAEQLGANRPQFESTLLLGHVSMLTAICVGTVSVAGGKPREYIITADRDEHIRVSRAAPQAHVIEGFCLGHEEFVSRLCVAPGGKAEVLISGGGDDDLFVWEWVKGEVLGRTAVLEHVKGVAGQEEASKVAVTRVFACTWEGRTGVFVVVERYVSLTLSLSLTLHQTPAVLLVNSSLTFPPASPRCFTTTFSRTTPSNTARPSPCLPTRLTWIWSKQLWRHPVFWLPSTPPQAR